MSETKKGLNRPEDSAFKQQRLKAWQPILTPLFVIGTFLCIGIVFIPIGAVLKIQGDGVFEASSLYDGDPSVVPVENANCSITSQNEGYVAIQNGTAKTCTLTFTFTKDLPTGATVDVFYQLTNFYQNHRRYVKSRSDDQVAGKVVSPSSSLSTLCDPNASYIAPEGTIYSPCGLIATSFFNDAFFLTEFNGAEAKGTGVTLDETNIAWTSDLSGKFFNPTGQGLNAWTTWRYLWQTYDQMSCYSDDTFTTRTQCLTWANVTGNSSVYGEGCAKCANPTDVYRYEGGIPPPGGPNAFNATPGAPGNATALFGFRDEHFINWMRTAGLPTFRKLYGRLTPPTAVGHFSKNDQVTFEVVPNFEVQSYGGTKSLVISTSTPIGGKSDVLGVAYIAVGSICWGLAIAFGIKHVVSPRKLGDTKYISSRHKKQ